MRNYLNLKIPDYATTTLSIGSTTVLPQIGDKHQIKKDFDDGSVSVVGVSANNVFEVQLQWNYISDADHDTLMDFWHDSSKGAGMMRTFCWEHPIDGYVYVVRFFSPVTSSYTEAGHISVSNVTLRVEGVLALLGMGYDVAWNPYTTEWKYYTNNWT
jgi:hypothetical protein